MVYFAGLCIYLLVGGFVFWLIEHQNEEEELEIAIEERVKFTRELARYLNQTFEDTEELVEHIANLCNREIFINDLDTIPRRWEYGPAVFFAMTVITTISQCG